jgi:hypothetical protein
LRAALLHRDSSVYQQLEGFIIFSLIRLMLLAWGVQW